MPKITRVDGYLIAGVFSPVVIEATGEKDQEPVQKAPKELKPVHRPFLSEAHTPEQIAKAIGIQE